MCGGFPSWEWFSCGRNLCRGQEPGLDDLEGPCIQRPCELLCGKDCQGMKTRNSRVLLELRAHNITGWLRAWDGVSCRSEFESCHLVASLLPNPQFPDLQNGDTNTYCFGSFQHSNTKDSAQYNTYFCHCLLSVEVNISETTPSKFCSPTECPRQCSGSGDKSSIFAIVACRTYPFSHSHTGCAPHNSWGCHPHRC